MKNPTSSCRFFPWSVYIISLLLAFAFTMMGQCCVTSFTTTPTKQVRRVYSITRPIRRNNVYLSAQQKKGFGEPSKKKITNVEPTGTSTATSTTSTATESSSSTSSSATTMPSSVSATTTTSSSSSSTAESNAGQKALEKLRRGRAEQKDGELRKVRELLLADEQTKVTSAAIPEPVANRMGKRMLPFVGLPLFVGMGTFVGFWYMATYQELEFQPALVASSTILILVFGLLGITYSVMSASWDPDREGGVLGVDEFKKNIKNIQQGFDRSKENAVLRDKMAGLSEDELKQALQDLEQREKQKQLTDKKQSLQRKIQNELE